MVDGLLAEQPDIHWDRLLFSAKEAVYKAWYPLTGSWLGFEDVSLAIDPDRRLFTASLLLSVPDPLVELGVSHFDGRWTIERDTLLTCVLVPARA